MSDLIERQAAIDAMTNTLWHYPGECYRNLNTYEFAKGLAELGLKSVPSAEPEPCEDTISRQAAIDAIRASTKKYTGFMEMEMYTDYDAVEAIISLPSAQPEIIRCRDCKYGSPNGRYGCRVYHYQKYETHDMEPDDFCSMAEKKII